MRHHRFIGDFALDKKTISITDKSFINQIRQVLRYKIGDEIILSDGKGREALGKILSINRNEIIVSISDLKNIQRGTDKEITLFISILRRENLEIVVQKATEIGVSKIIPMLTERTVKTGFNKERLEKIIREASEQSGRTVLPNITEPMIFEEAISSIDPQKSVLFDSQGERKTNIDAKNIFVGPEGGFSEKEVEIARAKNIFVASLGDLTLRAETAAIVTSFLACN